MAAHLNEPPHAAELEALRREIRDHGPTYTTFRDGRLRGGFTTDLKVSANGALGL